MPNYETIVGRFMFLLAVTHNWIGLLYLMGPNHNRVKRFQTRFKLTQTIHLTSLGPGSHHNQERHFSTGLEIGLKWSWDVKCTRNQ